MSDDLRDSGDDINDAVDEVLGMTEDEVEEIMKQDYLDSQNREMDDDCDDEDSINENDWRLGYESDEENDDPNDPWY